jgi:hypothetical protein
MPKKLINNTNLSDAEFRRAIKVYNVQKSKARIRKDRNGNPIGWQFTFDEWIDLWVKSGKWSQRGCRRGRYVMARFGDIGPYAPDNVEIKTTDENNSEKSKGIPKPKMTCIHCGKVGGAPQIIQWHNDNCRHKA